jgi:serine/threonine-protein kinase
MATVYKAYQPSLDRHVAVKVLSTFLAQEPDFIKRFEQEAKAIAKLNHPNILPVHDYGREGELIYIVMRYVEGGTLQDIMLGQSLDLDTAVEITTQMGGALDYAHQRGIVHRDVKPSNVLMADGNWALLSDFGLARMIGTSTKITKAGVGMGTPDYIAPEQARGARVDGRSDIYSLGIVLFEMLTGRVPFEGDTSLVVLYKHVTDPPPPPREINPDIPEAVEQVVLKALAKEPVDRFQRAGQMVRALQKAVTGGTVATAAISLVDERRQRERLAGLYVQAVTLLEAEEWQKALEKWAKVQAIDAAYPDPQEVASRAKRGLARLEAAVTPAGLGCHWRGHLVGSSDSECAPASMAEG